MFWLNNQLILKEIIKMNLENYTNINIYKRTFEQSQVANS